MKLDRFWEISFECFYHFLYSLFEIRQHLSIYSYLDSFLPLRNILPIFYQFIHI